MLSRGQFWAAESVLQIAFECSSETATRARFHTICESIAILEKAKLRARKHQVDDGSLEEKNLSDEDIQLARYAIMQTFCEGLLREDVQSSAVWSQALAIAAPDRTIPRVSLRQALIEFDKKFLDGTYSLEMSDEKKAECLDALQVMEAEATNNDCFALSRAIEWRVKTIRNGEIPTAHENLKVIGYVPFEVYKIRRPSLFLPRSISHRVVEKERTTLSKEQDSEKARSLWRAPTNKPSYLEQSSRGFDNFNVSGIEAAGSAIAIEEFNEQQEDIPLYEEQCPPKTDQSGGLNIQPNPKKQRSDTVVLKRRSEFETSISLVVCLHGKQSPAQPDDLSLIIVKVHLGVHERGVSYNSVRMSLEFERESETNTQPEVVTWAPFRTVQKVESAETEIFRTADVRSTLGVEERAKLGLGAGVESQRNFKQQVFKRPTSSPLCEDSENGDRTTGIEWWFAANSTLETSAELDLFRAVLVRPPKDPQGAAAPFRGILDMRVEAGTTEDIKTGARRFFRPRESKSVLFDPNSPMALNNTGYRVRTILERDKDNLGKYMGDGLLDLIGAINQ